MNFREYDPAQDKEAAHRIWLETGWIEDNDKQKEAMDIFLSGGHTLVADLNGEPECLVASMPGSIRYLAEDLALSVIQAVVLPASLAASLANKAWPNASPPISSLPMPLRAPRSQR